LNESWGTVHRRIGLGSLAVVLATGALALVAAPASAASAQTRYVATNGDDGSEPVNDCTVKTKPCKTIQHAVDEASAGDTVSIAAGHFAESIEVVKSLTIVGSTSGTTTVTGTSGGGPLPAAFNVVPGGEQAPVVTFNDLNISGNQQGMGIENVVSTVVLDRVTVANNVGGGLLAEHGGSNTIRHSAINGNGQIGVGVIDGQLSISDTSVADTSSPAGDEGLGLSGFGVLIGSSSAQITRSTFSDNAFAGIFAAGTAIPSALSTAIPGSTPRVAAAPVPAELSISASTIAGNGLAGVASEFGQNVTIDASTISGNHGAGVLGELSTTTITNSTITGTEPFTTIPNQPAGSVPPPSGVLYVTNVPTQPTAGLAPAGTQKSAFGIKGLIVRTVAPAADPDFGVTVSGTALSQAEGVADCSRLTIGNDDTFVPDPDNPAVTDAGYNLSADATNSCSLSSAQHDLVKTDPKLGALANNGGPTKTEAPLKGSPAIDAIPAGKAGCVADATDQRGVARPQPTGGRCDVGAVELAAKAIVIHPGSLPHGTVGKKYHVTFTATGGQFPSYTWSLAPGSTLPDGLKFSSAGVLSGTPTKAGNATFTVSVNDPVLKRYTLVIDAAAAPADNGSAPIAATGSPIGQLTTTGGLAVLGGLLVLLAAGLIGRRPGRHRTN
jgi:hypothetical protein